MGYSRTMLIVAWEQMFQFCVEHIYTQYLEKEMHLVSGDPRSIFKAVHRGVISDLRIFFIFKVGVLLSIYLIHNNIRSTTH